MSPGRVTDDDGRLQHVRALRYKSIRLIDGKERLLASTDGILTLLFFLRTSVGRSSHRNRPSARSNSHIASLVFSFGGLAIAFLYERFGCISNTKSAARRISCRSVPPAVKDRAQQSVEFELRRKGDITVRSETSIPSSSSSSVEFLHPVCGDYLLVSRSLESIFGARGSVHCGVCGLRRKFDALRRPLILLGREGKCR